MTSAVTLKGPTRTLRRSRWLLPLVLGAAVGACSEASGRSASGPPSHSPARPVRRALQGVTVPGLSGATVEGDTVWAIAERDPVLVPLRFEGGSVVAAGAPTPLLGLAEGLDTESLALLADGRFAIGTERALDRDTDVILIAERRDEGVQVVDRIELAYDLWKMRPRPNNGIEGLCRSGDHLVAVMETAIEDGGARYAPLGVYHLSAKTWIAARLRLTTPTGKISGLDCAGERALAIERHYGVARLLRFTVPRAPGDVEPQVVRELFLGDGEQPNYESIVRVPGGAVVLLSDNQMSAVTGPAQSLVLPAVD